jgi:hypothetical protein
LADISLLSVEKTDVRKSIGAGLLVVGILLMVAIVTSCASNNDEEFQVC